MLLRSTTVPNARTTGGDRLAGANADIHAVEQQLREELARSLALSRQAQKAFDAITRSQQRLMDMLDRTEQLRRTKPRSGSVADRSEIKRGSRAKPHTAMKSSSALAPDSLAAARLHGQEQLVAWTEDGSLLPSAELAVRWGMRRQALAKKADVGKLFGVKVGRRVYYPAALASLPQAFAESLCSALGPLNPSQKLIFLLRPHGALGGKTVVRAVEAGQGARALALAEGWAAEHGEPA